MSKKLNKLAQKKANAAARDARLAEALSKQKKLERDRARVHVKRPAADGLQRYVLPGVMSNAIRPAAAFASNTYSPSRRLMEFLDHLFVRYPAPLFLYRSLLTPEGRYLSDPYWLTMRKPAGWEREAFFAAAQGRSVADVLKDRLTRKETHWFLQAPNTYSAQVNLAWAKLTAAGNTSETTEYLLRRFGVGDFLKQIGSRFDEIARFFAQEAPSMNEVTQESVVDFVAVAYRTSAFSLAGRTLGSVVQLADRWHATWYVGGPVRKVTWLPCLPFWELKFPGYLIRAVELTSSRAMLEEGQRQRHCVYSYIDGCLSGWYTIVSLRWISDVYGEPRILKRLTVEVSRRSRSIVQVSGACNRCPDDEETKVLRRWAGDHGLTVSHL